MIDYDYLKSLVEKYDSPKKQNYLILIPFSDFPRIEAGNSVREYDWWAMAMKQALFPSDSVFTIANYKINCVCVIREAKKMCLDVTIAIPYGKRSMYWKWLYRICSAISSDGDVTLFVSNNPYDLKAYAVISEESSAHAEKIKTILRELQIQYNSEKGLKELMKEAGIGRMYNILQLPSHESPDMFHTLFDNQFFFREESEHKSVWNDLQHFKRF